MQRLLALLTFAFFLYGGVAFAVPRYLVEDSSNVIKSYTEDDSLVAPPGHTAVNVSVIEAVVYVARFTKAGHGTERHTHRQQALSPRLMELLTKAQYS